MDTSSEKSPDVANANQFNDVAAATTTIRAVQSYGQAIDSDFAKYLKRSWEHDDAKRSSPEERESQVEELRTKRRFLEACALKNNVEIKIAEPLTPNTRNIEVETKQIELFPFGVLDALEPLLVPRWKPDFDAAEKTTEKRFLTQAFIAKFSHENKSDIDKYLAAAAVKKSDEESLAAVKEVMDVFRRFYGSVQPNLATTSLVEQLIYASTDGQSVFCHAGLEVKEGGDLALIAKYFNNNPIEALAAKIQACALLGSLVKGIERRSSIDDSPFPSRDPLRSFYSLFLEHCDLPRAAKIFEDLIGGSFENVFSLKIVEFRSVALLLSIALAVFNDLRGIMNEKCMDIFKNPLKKIIASFPLPLTQIVTPARYIRVPLDYHVPKSFKEDDKRDSS